MAAPGLGQDQAKGGCLKMKAAVLHDYDEALKRLDFVRYEEVPEPSATH